MKICFVFQMTNPGPVSRIRSHVRNTKPETRNQKFPDAFTLIEIVLALGILTFALVGILGLFPIALASARDSKSETMAILIAQSIAADLRSLQQSGTNESGDPTWTSGIAHPPSTIPVNLLASPAASITLAYFREGSTGLVPQATDVSSHYATGIPGAEYLARITTEFDTPGHPGLCVVEIQIESPASAPEPARTKTPFFTLLHKR